jgi:Fe2+ or Zn2+ uptake regulation protein
MAKYSKEDIITLLREKGLRVTDHRVAVLVYLSRTKEPVPVHEIFDTLRKKYAIDQATVYRNLSSLHEEGVIRRFDFNHGHAHYELEIGRVSYQIVCSKCKTLEKMEGVSLDDGIKKMLKKSKKFKNSQLQTAQLYSVCKSCN